LKKVLEAWKLLQIIMSTTYNTAENLRAVQNFKDQAMTIDCKS